MGFAVLKKFGESIALYAVDTVILADNIAIIYSNNGMDERHLIGFRK